MGKQDLKAELSFFDKMVDKQSSYDTLSEEVYQLIFNKISPYLKGDVLDAGCGAGAFGERVARLGKPLSITGIDINPKMILLAKEKGIYRKLICANVENKEIFGQQSFDCILAPFLVHHFPEIERLFENFYFWLKPGGFLIIVDPNGSNPISKATYALRQLLSRITDLSSLVSPNEKNKTIKEFKNGLKNFKVVILQTFLGKPKKQSSLNFSLLRGFSALWLQLLLNFYASLPFLKYRGSGVLIVAKKISRREDKI